MPKLFYAVRRPEPGIYKSWDECSKIVNGTSGSIYKGFNDYDQAYQFAYGPVEPYWTKGRGSKPTPEEEEMLQGEGGKARRKKKPSSERNPGTGPLPTAALYGAPYGHHPPPTLQHPPSIQTMSAPMSIPPPQHSLPPYSYPQPHYNGGPILAAFPLQPGYPQYAVPPPSYFIAAQPAPTAPHPQGSPPGAYPSQPLTFPYAQGPQAPPNPHLLYASQTSPLQMPLPHPYPMPASGLAATGPSLPPKPGPSSNPSPRSPSAPQPHAASAFVRCVPTTATTTTNAGSGGRPPPPAAVVERPKSSGAHTGGATTSDKESPSPAASPRSSAPRVVPPQPVVPVPVPDSGEDGGRSGQGEGTFVLEFDGGSRGNPGLGGSGAVLYDPRGRAVAEVAHSHPGPVTNNEAEYTGLIKGLEAAKQLGVRRLSVKGDSSLVVQQMKGAWAVKAENLRGLHERASLLARSFDAIDFTHIYREANAAADRLANEAMDGRGWEGHRTPPS